MKKETIIEGLDSLLPHNGTTPSLSAATREQTIADAAHTIKSAQDAKALAQAKYAEKKALELAQKRAEEDLERRRAIAEETGVALDDVPSRVTPSQARAIIERQKKVEAIEAIEEAASSPLSPEAVAEVLPANGNSREVASLVARASSLTTTRPEVLKLLSQLNINLNIQLSKTDTANLLACLLTCNDTQLAALYSNKKVPVAIKTVIKRLQDDAALGNIETIEKLWDRVFGKHAMSLNLPEEQQLRTGIIPDTPVSREAYIVIRDTLIK